MESQRYTLSSLRQDIVDHNLHVKAIIQVSYKYIFYSLYIVFGYVLFNQKFILILRNIVFYANRTIK